jgi:hypothetical protein
VKKGGFSLFLRNTASEAHRDTPELRAHWSEKRWGFSMCLKNTASEAHIDTAELGARWGDGGLNPVP